jgi:DNA invertase Pin-like site-specific DNA recombinase
MNILYTRISTVDQKSSRQNQKADEFDFLVEDK